MKKITLILATIYFSINAYSQKDENWCITDQVTKAATLADPDYAAGLNEAQDILRNTSSLKTGNKKKSGVIYTVPVVVHVIYDTYRDNISREQIEDGIRVLNEDFRRMNADTGNTRSIFKGVAADVEIEFKLAKKDPNGNCTDGITRTQSSLTINARDNVKSLVHWDNDRYFNIWVVNSIDPQGNQGTVLGYAYLPSTNQSFDRDGMVIRHDRLGTIGTSVSLGRTLPHEAGHYLGLRHPFGYNDNCSSGDGIDDTPPVASANFGCNYSANSCHTDSPDLPDMIENYMDYADDECTNLFTQGQKAIMRSTLENSQLRADLISASNLSFTGITNPPACLPTAMFNKNKEVICAGESIAFSEVAEGGNPTSWQWSFPGGTPSSSTVKNPTITYSTSGVYPVTLIVSNSAGSDTITSQKEVHVKTLNSTVYYPNWEEDFEDPAINSDLTVVDDGDDITFELSSEAASTGDQSLKLNNFSSSVEGGEDELISPAINTLFAEGLSLSFDYAFAPKNSTSNDKLSIYVSEDCGATWSLRRNYQSFQLVTGDVTSQPFVPAFDEWGTQTISFSGYEGPDPLLVKFVFTHGAESNNFYLDNINFSGSIGLDEKYTSSINIFPNPAEDKVSITMENGDLDQSLIEIKDLSGKNLFRKKLENTGNRYDIDLSDMNLPSGVYMLSITKGDKTGIQKLIVR